MRLNHQYWKNRIVLRKKHLSWMGVWLSLWIFHRQPPQLPKSFRSPDFDYSPYFHAILGARLPQTQRIEFWFWTEHLGNALRTKLSGTQLASSTTAQARPGLSPCAHSTALLVSLLGAMEGRCWWEAPTSSLHSPQPNLMRMIRAFPSLGEVCSALI